jgi:hypothetical protein
MKIKIESFFFNECDAVDMRSRRKSGRKKMKALCLFAFVFE